MASAGLVDDRAQEMEHSERRICGKSIDLSDWPTFDEATLVGAQQERYFARKYAVTLYLRGASYETLAKSTSLSGNQIYRLISERCLAIHPDGREYGWRGLVPYARIRPYRRTKKVCIDQFGSGGVGALESTLNAYPALRHAFEKRIRTVAPNQRLVHIGPPLTRHCKWLLDELRRLGCEARGEWPFNTRSLAYYSVRRYVEKTLAESPTALASSIGGPRLVRKLKTGDGTGRPVTRFMQRVEMDAHKIDGRFCVSVAQPDGSFQEKIIHRLWVIVIIEIVSRAVLGYRLSMGKEVSKDDVLRAIKSALGKWTPRPVVFSAAPFAKGAGFLSALGDEFVGLCWDETSVDGALAETCQHVSQALLNAVGAVILEPKSSFAKRRSMDDRPFIETFFRTLAGRGFQRLSNTTGRNTTGRSDRKPDEVAISSKFQLEYAEELLNVLIANYNGTPHSGIGFHTPLEYAKFLYDNTPAKLRRADSSQVQTFFSFRRCCVVRGGAKSGRSPYVEFCYARYTNETLQQRQDLVGTKIWVISHIDDDGRVAIGSTLDGGSLGVLRAAPPWHRSPHSVTVRNSIYKISKRLKFSLTEGNDGIGAFINFVERQPKGKLPVHPTYLEVRRILANALPASITGTMLDSALQRLESDRENCQSAPVEGGVTLFEEVSKENEALSRLPPPTMAASD